MDNKVDQYELLVDEDYNINITEQEAKEFTDIIRDFIESYKKNLSYSEKTWATPKMKEYMPDKSNEEIASMTDEIVEDIRIYQDKKESLEKAVNNGRSKENWFASDVQKALSDTMSTQESGLYLQALDNAVNKANESFYKLMTTKSGQINQNPCLDGYLAEEYHVQTFNMNAEARGSEYRAYKLEPDGGRYTKNSVDTVVCDKNGKVTSRYQLKYCKDSQSTERAFEHGDYRGQQKLVPEGQQSDIQKKTTTVMKAPDGTTSNPLTKTKAEQMRDEAQGGQWNDINWNEYKLQDLAIGIGKQAGNAALLGAGIGAGIDVVQKLWNNEEIETDEIIKNALISGADAGTKVALTCALKVASEKGIIKIIPKTDLVVYAGIANIAVEDAKVLYKMGTGELDAREAVEKLEETTIATAAGSVAMVKGAKWGEKAWEEIGKKVGEIFGTTFGPIGRKIGGFICGTIGYMAGSTVGKIIAKATQKVISKAGEMISNALDKVKEGFSNLKDRVTSFFCWW